MKELYNFLNGKTVKLGELQEVPTVVLRKWVNDYQELSEEEKQETSFQDYIEDNSWVMINIGFKKFRDCEIFMLDKNDPTHLFDKEEVISHEFVKDYFRQFFNDVFIEKDSLNVKKLKEWIKSSVGRFKEDAYLGLVERAENLDMTEVKEILLSLMVQSLDITTENYFDMMDKPIPSMDEAEFLIANFVDCTDPNVPIEDKWNYLRIYGNVDCKTIRRVLYKMSSFVNSERRTIVRMTSMKDKKINLGMLLQLNQENQHIFCRTWQIMTGK